MSSRAIVAVMCVAFAHLAAADSSSETTPVNGFVTTAVGELRGTVTDSDGRPVAGATVHVVPGSGARTQVRTDAKGTYRAQLRGGEVHVFIDGPGQVVGSVVTGDDVIEVHDVTPPAVAAEPKKPPTAIPPYTDAAIEADVWVRAWVMLHVDASGAVRHVKLIRDPGYGLAATAIRHAFGLAFEPARDRAGRPTRSLVLWSYEWPSYSWLTRGGHSIRRLPSSVTRVPCRSGDKPRSRERDCAKPDMTAAAKVPWVARRQGGR